MSQLGQVSAGRRRKERERTEGKRGGGEREAALSSTVPTQADVIGL